MTLEAIFGNWIFGPQYGFLNIPRNTTRHFDVSAVYGGGRTQYTREKHGLRGDFRNPADIDMLVIGGSTTNELYIDDAALVESDETLHDTMIDP
ncbi:MAG: hypothetical protein WD407_08970, partial [Rhodospirillales bacterium]